MMRLLHDRTGAVIATAVTLADTRASRRRGLLGRDSMEEGEALMLSPCGAIHTFFMRFAIDVIFVDGDGCVVRTVSRMRPWRLAAAWRARTVIELPAGRLEALARGSAAGNGEHAVNVGDQVYVAPVREERRAS
jgi:uncharacterized membrane protein (UPF0127 family)